MMIDDIILDENNIPIVVIPYGKDNIGVPAEVVWRSLYKQCLEEFPHARAEAIHISAEAPTDTEVYSGDNVLDTEEALDKRGDKNETSD
jgi:hypothetical protein